MNSFNSRPFARNASKTFRPAFDYLSNISRSAIELPTTSKQTSKYSTATTHRRKTTADSIDGIDDDIENNIRNSAYYDSARQHIATMLFQSLISALLVFILPVSAQFQFFEQMFNQGGHQQQQQPQNAGSDSAWYQQRYEDGMT